MLLSSVYNISTAPTDAAEQISAYSDTSESNNDTAMSCGCGDSCYVVCGGSCVSEVASGTWAEDTSTTNTSNNARIVSSIISTVGTMNIKSSNLINKNGGEK